MSHLSTPIIPRFSVVGAREISRLVRSSTHGQVELVRRQSQGVAVWRHRQPRPMLFRIQGKLRRYRLDIGGQVASENKPSTPGIFYVPAHTTAEAEFEFKGEIGYTLLFFNDAGGIAPLRTHLQRPLTGLNGAELKVCLSALSREAVVYDDLFDVVSDSWITQTLVHLNRAAGHASPRPTCRGGLTIANSRRIEEYVRANFAEKINISEMANVAGLCPRHFIRAFRQSFQETPIQFVLGLRVEEAKRKLASTGDSVTGIALACGFSDGQHFSTTFRKMVGESPSGYRRVVER